MRPQKFHIIGDTQREAAIHAVSAAKVGQTVTIADRNRSAEQNALFHLWCSDIAKQKKDCTMMDVKWQANMDYTLPLRMQDAVFAWIWENIAPKLNEIQLRKWCEHPKNKPKLSSGLDVDQMTQMLDAFRVDFIQQGYHLSDPRDHGWQT